MIKADALFFIYRADSDKCIYEQTTYLIFVSTKLLWFLWKEYDTKLIWNIYTEGLPFKYFHISVILSIKDIIIMAHYELSAVI